MIKDSVCKDCKYRGGKGKAYYKTCDYSLKTDKTCLYEVNGVLIDRRGDDPNKCNLYERGRSSE